MALESCIGWILTGPYQSPQSESHISITTRSAVHSAEQNLDETLKRFLEIESVGNTAGICLRSIQGGRRRRTRLLPLRGKFDKDPKLLNYYTQILKDYEANGII